MLWIRWEKTGNKLCKKVLKQVSLLITGSILYGDGVINSIKMINVDVKCPDLITTVLLTENVTVREEKWLGQTLHRHRQGLKCEGCGGAPLGVLKGTSSTWVVLPWTCACPSSWLAQGCLLWLWAGRSWFLGFYYGRKTGGVDRTSTVCVIFLRYDRMSTVLSFGVSSTFPTVPVRLPRRCGGHSEKGDCLETLCCSWYIDHQEVCLCTNGMLMAYTSAGEL